MDKVKVILKQLQKYHFWILSVIAIIASLVGWSMASKSLSSVYSAEKQKIESKFKELASLKNVDKPPNSSWKAELDKVTEAQTEKVAAAWKAAYDAQADQRTWPEYLEQLATNPNAFIRGNQRAQYAESCLKEFEELLKIADVRPSGSEGRSPGGGADEPSITAEAGHEYAVTWESQDQRVAQRLFFWPDNMPTDKQIRNAQEDLWVYRTLLQVIAAMNKDQFVPRVKNIHLLNIGKPAATALADGMRAKGGAPAQDQAAPQPQMAQPQQQPGEGEAGPSDEGRYVDIDGKPVPNDVAVKSPFKCVPVHMKLQIDQREVTRLLTECINAALPIDVLQLRINPEGKARAEPSGATAGARPAMPVQVPGAAAAPRGTAGDDPYETPVEIHGILYIFNPPDMANVTDALVVRPRKKAAASVVPGGPGQ